MLNVALTGNIAAGKSTVMGLFRGWGATVIDADQLARDAQRPGSPVLHAIARRFGGDLIRPNGELDRAALRSRVMGNPADLAELNAIVHPAVHQAREHQLAEARRRGDRIVVNDIPLLFEVLYPGAFDAVVLVDAPEAMRRQWLMDLRGFTPEDADRALASQEPAPAKRLRSDFVIDNDGGMDTLETKARDVWARIQAQAKGASV